MAVRVTPRAVVPRFVTLWCPHWPVVAAGPHPDEPLAVLHANRVVAHSTAAGAHGVAVGQRRREAQARCPQLRIEPDDPEREARQFTPVVVAVAELVPRLEITEPGSLAFAARGPSRYFGGDAAMAALIASTATTAAPHVPAVVGGFGVGVADGRFTAAVAARRAVRSGTSVVVGAGAEATAVFLAPLSVRLLTIVAGLEPSLAELFGRLGLRRLGDLAALPAADVLARFGHAGAFAHAVAGGGDERPAGTQDPPVDCFVERAFEEAVHDTDTLVFVARHLATELADRLAGDGQVCTRLAVTAETEHGEHSERVWHRPEGLGAMAMVERVRWQLDAWVRHGEITAGVTLVRLEPAEVRGDDGVQLGLWGGRTQADEWAARAVARLATVAGEQQVLVPAAGGGRQPDDAVRWVPAVLADLADPAEACRRLVPSPGPWPGRLPAPSPAVIHAPPLPLTVTCSDGSAVRVGGRGLPTADPAVVEVRGRAEAITGWAGPWPVEERWWDPQRARRSARFQLLTASGRLLLAVVEHQQWHLVAEYA